MLAQTQCAKCARYPTRPTHKPRKTSLCYPVFEACKIPLHAPLSGVCGYSRVHSAQARRCTMCPLCRHAGVPCAQNVLLSRRHGAHGKPLHMRAPSAQACVPSAQHIDACAHTQVRAQHPGAPHEHAQRTGARPTILAHRADRISARVRLAHGRPLYDFQIYFRCCVCSA